MPVRLPIQKLAASAVAPLQSVPRFPNELLQSRSYWAKDTLYLRDVYDQIYEIWDRLKAPEQDQELYIQTEPHLRELLLGLEAVSQELSTRVDIMRDVTNAHHDFDVAGSYAKIGDYGIASVYASYALMKLHRVLTALTLYANKKRGSVDKLAYGYDVCLTGDTKIPLLDGTEVAIRDLVGRGQFWVYSLNDKGLLRPGVGHSARLTLKNAAILTVTLDNGEAIMCTLTHPFLMRNGEYKLAEMLMAGDSLMPLYRGLAQLEAGGNEYQTTYQPATDSWVFTHRFVEARCPKGYVRHHRDFNRFNNSPENIQLMTWEDHQKLHREVGFPVTEKCIIARRNNALQMNILKKGVPFTQEHKQALSIAQESVSGEIKKLRGKIGAGVLTNFNKSQKGRTLGNHQRWHVNRNVVNRECSLCMPVNHKVVSIVHWGTADVYDISVDKYHNFALSAGVFVHNSGEVHEQGGTSGQDKNEYDQGNSPEFEHTSPNPVSVAQDYEAEDEFPELAESKHKRMEFPPRTR